MKRGTLLHSDISTTIANMGHTDSLTIGDCGLPTPPNTKKIDLALTRGVPSFLETLKVVLSELCVERVLLAKEIRDYSPAMHEQILAVLHEYRKESGFAAELAYTSHETFKTKVGMSSAVIRTGEATPYSNIILYSGVVF